jgi:hypothetical protein
MKLSDLFPAADPWVQNLPNLFPAWIAADSEWMLALFGAMHLLALAGMGGCSLVLGLRLMGVTLKTIPTADLYRSIKPWLWGAVILGLATGTIMGMATATRNFSSPVFSLKVMSIIAGVILTFGTVGVISRADRKDLGLSRNWAMVAANVWLLIALGLLMQGQTYWAFNMVVLGGIASAVPSGAGRKPVIWITGLALLSLLLMNIIPTYAFYEKNVFELDALGQPVRQIFQSNGKPVVDKVYYWHLLSADTRNGLLGFLTVLFSESLRIAVNRRIFATETETQAATITYGFAMALWLMTMWLFADSFDGKPGASLIAGAAFLFAVGLSGFRTRAALIGMILIVAITVATIASSRWRSGARSQRPIRTRERSATRSSCTTSTCSMRCTSGPCGRCRSSRSASSAGRCSGRARSTTPARSPRWWASPPSSSGSPSARWAAGSPSPASPRHMRQIRPPGTPPEAFSFGPAVFQHVRPVLHVARPLVGRRGRVERVG